MVARGLRGQAELGYDNLSHFGYIAWRGEFAWHP